MNPPIPFPSSTLTVSSPAFATARSSWNGLLLLYAVKNPNTTQAGFDPTGNGLPGAAVNPSVAVANSTVTVLSPELAIARSLPGAVESAPWKFPAAIDDGALPTWNGLPAIGTNAEVPAFPPGCASTDMVLSTVFAVAKPSPDGKPKIPGATDVGPLPTANGPPYAAVNPLPALSNSAVTVLAAVLAVKSVCK